MDFSIYRTVATDGVFLDKDENPTTPDQAVYFSCLMDGSKVKVEISHVELQNRKVLIGFRKYPFITRDLVYLPWIPLKSIYGFTHKGMTVYISAELSWAKTQLRSGYLSISAKMLAEDNTIIINNIYDIIEDNDYTYLFAEDGKVYKYKL